MVVMKREHQTRLESHFEVEILEFYGSHNAKVMLDWLTAIKLCFQECIGASHE